MTVSAGKRSFSLGRLSGSQPPREPAPIPGLMGGSVTRSLLHTKSEYLAAMDARQLACRFRHSFPSLLNGIPKGFDAVPMRAGVMLITETCPVCTTRLIYETAPGGHLDGDVRTRTTRYEYPEWWVHVPRKDGVFVSMADARAVLWEEQLREIKALARKHGRIKAA